jgi:maleylpyruvate isomerase
MELFGYYRSSASYRVRIALNLKHIEVSHIPVNLASGEQHQETYTRINPQGLVPLLRLADGRTLSQSTAILEYLETVYTETPLLPADPFEAAKVRAWVNSIACDVQPLNNLRVQKYLSAQFAADDEQKSAWLSNWVDRSFSALELSLEASPYCNGERPGLADVYLIPQVYNAIRFKQDLSAYPKIVSIYEQCNTLDAFKRAAPDQQADAV